MGAIENENPVQKKLANQSINYWKIIKILFSRWYWVAGAALIGAFLAFLHIRSTAPIYFTAASLKLDNGDQSQLAVPNSPLNYRYYKPNQIQTEGIIMRSDEVVLKAIQQINYKISYFIEGRVLTTDVYPFIPFNIAIIKQDSLNFNRALYHVKSLNKGSFQLLSPEHPNQWMTYRYGEKIETGMMEFAIVTTIPNKGKYSFKFNSVVDLLGRAVNGLNITEQEKNTNIMQVTHTDVNAQFSADILNAIINQYVVNDADQKKRSAVQTIDYLDGRLTFLDSIVNKSSDNLSDFQTQNKLIDPVTDKQMNSGKVSDLQQKIADLQLKQLNITQLADQLKTNRDLTEINLDLEGTGNAVLSGLIVEYNTVVNERNVKLRDFKIGSAPINLIDQRLNTIKQTIASNIRLLSQSNKKTIDFISAQLGSASQVLNQIPKKQNDFTKLQNTVEVNNKIRDMLVERKLTAQISSASIVPGATIVSLAQPNFAPVSPIKRNIYTSYIFIGLLAGIGLIIFMRMVNPYIYDVETIEGLTTTPIIGVILKYPDKMDNDFRRILSLDKPKSVFSESVRSVRTNLSFMASQKVNKVICVTSEISGEGKSFVTINLAGTLAIIDKRVIVIAGDLRRSKLHKTFDSANKKGLSTYLSAKDSIEDIIGHDELHHIDYITSGPVPPNPSELLHSSLMDDLIETLKKTYEYIIIDTAPVGLVSDSIPLIRKADINLFIIRSGVSSFRAASIPERLSKEYSLNNIAIIINSFGNEKLHANIYSTNYAHGTAGAYYYSDYTGYGNYGYYDNNTRKKWWQFWKK